MAILKQLVVHGRAVVDGKFLGIQDLVDGRAAIIKKCNLDICMTLDLTSTMHLGLAVFVLVL